jgi:putative ABC transport system permease protein
VLSLLALALLRDRARTLLSVACVASALALVLTFEGVRAGLHRQTRSFAAGLPAALVAMQSGVANLLGARSVLPQDVRRRIEDTAGVAAAHPLAGLPVIYSRGELISPVYVLAYDSAGGPRVIVDGRGIAKPDELVVDAVLARRHGVRSGDTVEFLGHPFVVAGLSAETSNPFNPYVYARLDDLIDLYLAGDLPSELAESSLGFLLIDVTEGADVESVRRELERAVPEVDVFTPREIGESDVGRVEGFLGPALSLLIAISWLVCALVVGLTLYASVQGRLGEVAVMRAIGARPIDLVRLVLGEALIVSALGFVAALALGLVLARLLGIVAPQYPVDALDARVIARALVAGITMACVAPAFAARRAITADPALVFAQ